MSQQKAAVWNDTSVQTIRLYEAAPEAIGARNRDLRARLDAFYADLASGAVPNTAALPHSEGLALTD